MLTEYIFLNRTNLMNGMVVSGKAVEVSLCRIEKNRCIFDKCSEWANEFRHRTFYLNPKMLKDLTLEPVGAHLKVGPTLPPVSPQREITKYGDVV